jgi:hypothetical protein
MTLLLILLIVVAILAMTGGPVIYRRRGRVVERVYEDRPIDGI